MYDVETLQDHEAVQMISEISGRSVASVAAMAVSIAEGQGARANMESILAMGVLAALLDQFEATGAPGPNVITV